MKDNILKWLSFKPLISHFLHLIGHEWISDLTLFILSLIKCLLDIPTSKLINGTLKDMPSQASVIYWFFIIHILYQFFQKLTSFDLVLALPTLVGLLSIYHLIWLLLLRNWVLDHFWLSFLSNLLVLDQFLSLLNYI